MSDMHGNRLAVEAVVADGEEQGVEAWWVLGDLVAIGADPVATLELLTNLPDVRFVRGNTDRYVVTGERPPPFADEVRDNPTLSPLFDLIEASFLWTRDRIAESGWLDWLAELPREQRVNLADGTRLLGVHASPRSDDGLGITPDVSDADLGALMADVDADVVCGGHTHQPTDRRVGAVRAINLGSVSNPITSDLRASYVVIEADGREHRVEHRRVPYDHDAVLARIEHSGHPAAEFLSEFQRGQQVRFEARPLSKFGVARGS
jgi:predicted phosphodiesterase